MVRCRWRGHVSKSDECFSGDTLIGNDKAQCLRLPQHGGSNGGRSYPPLQAFGRAAFDLLRVRSHREEIVKSGNAKHSLHPLLSGLIAASFDGGSA
tara:strand:+ start:2686 stop:2973 length:288 start_codon:yes stop_codon:yes gene_type:complete